MDEIGVGDEHVPLAREKALLSQAAQPDLHVDIVEPVKDFVPREAMAPVVERVERYLVASRVIDERAGGWVHVLQGHPGGDQRMRRPRRHVEGVDVPRLGAALLVVEAVEEDGRLPEQVLEDGRQIGFEREVPDLLAHQVEVVELVMAGLRMRGLRPERAPARLKAVDDNLGRPLADQPADGRGRPVDLLRPEVSLKHQVTIPFELGCADARLGFARPIQHKVHANP
jgi:hypothetical protein